MPRVSRLRPVLFSALEIKLGEAMPQIQLTSNTFNALTQSTMWQRFTSVDTGALTWEAPLTEAIAELWNWNWVH